MLDESADNVERAGGFESTLECERAEQDESIQRIERALPMRASRARREYPENRASSTLSSRRRWFYLRVSDRHLGVANMAHSDCAELQFQFLRSRHPDYTRVTARNSFPIIEISGRAPGAPARRRSNVLILKVFRLAYFKSSVSYCGSLDLRPRIQATKTSCICFEAARVSEVLHFILLFTTAAL